MKERFITMPLTALVGLSTICLTFSATTSASAEPAPAPTTTMSSDQTFVVPPDGSGLSRPIEVYIGFTSSDPRDHLSAFDVTLTCRSGYVLLLTRNDHAASPSGGPAWVSLDGDIPISQVGQTCVVHGTAPAGRSLVFGSPWNKPGDHRETRQMFTGSILVQSRTGGL